MNPTPTEIADAILYAAKQSPVLGRWASKNADHVRYVAAQAPVMLIAERLNRAVEDADRYAQEGQNNKAWHAWRRTDKPLQELQQFIGNWAGKREAEARAEAVFRAHRGILGMSHPPPPPIAHDDDSAFKRDQKRAADIQAANAAEEENLRGIANEALREARRVTLGEGGDTSKKGQFRAADIVATARSRIANMATSIAPRGSGRWHNLMMIDAELYNNIKDLFAECERIEANTKPSPHKGNATTQDALRTLITLTAGQGERTINWELSRLGFGVATVKDLSQIGGWVSPATEVWSLYSGSQSCDEATRRGRGMALEAHSYKRGRLGYDEWQRQRDAMVMEWIKQDAQAQRRRGHYQMNDVTGKREWVHTKEELQDQLKRAQQAVRDCKRRQYSAETIAKVEADVTRLKQKIASMQD